MSMQCLQHQPVTTKSNNYIRLLVRRGAIALLQTIMRPPGLVAFRCNKCDVLEILRPWRLVGCTAQQVTDDTGRSCSHPALPAELFQLLVQREVAKTIPNPVASRAVRNGTHGEF